MQTTDLRKSLERAQGRKEAVRFQINETTSKIKALKAELRITEKAQEAIQIAAKETQSELKLSISEITSLALESVYSNPYELYLLFRIERGRTGCIIKFKRDGQLYTPLFNTGGGPAITGALGLRCAMLSLSVPQPRKLLILDEPFLSIQKNLRSTAMQVLKVLSEELEMQIIMTTHERELIEGGDRIFNFRLRNKRTIVKMKRKLIV